MRRETLNQSININRKKNKKHRKGFFSLALCSWKFKRKAFEILIKCNPRNDEQI